MYEIFVDEKNKIIETGNILYANLILSGEDNSLYYFDKDKSSGHFDKNGKSVQKALMKTPINGARLSSPFGMRKHPIDGFIKWLKVQILQPLRYTYYGFRFRIIKKQVMW